ncbi:alpha/beta hydrolase [Nocardia sp. CA-290969]|uniref:alpha/beta hydrolase n=1 Tax=Nocardia sp. CA-290969 TaxID=3239986 RepID=UPI003D934774
MVSPEAVEFVESLKRHGERMVAVAGLSLDDQRVVAEGLQAMTGPARGVAFHDASTDTVPGVWVRPEGSDVVEDAAIVYVHGGGYVYGTPVGYRNLAGHVAKAAGVAALIPKYRRAPEHPFPAGLDDVLAAYRALLERGIAPEKIAFVGDSAGGGLVLATLLRIRDSDLPMPATAALMSPWVDLEATGASMVTNAGVDLLASAEGMRALGSLYAPGATGDPIASPVLNDYSGLCPLFIQAGGHEALLDDSTRVRDKAIEAGIPVEFEVFPEMQHVFQLGAGHVPEADEAVAKLGAYVRTVLAKY